MIIYFSLLDFPQLITLQQNLYPLAGLNPPKKKKKPPWPILESCFRIVKPTILEQKETTTNANCSKMKHPGTARIP
jgi:hypothetical protein